MQDIAVGQILQSSRADHVVTGVWPSSDADNCPFTGSFGTYPNAAGAVMFFTEPEIQSQIR